MDSLTNDMEKLECADDFLQAPKRKRKSGNQPQVPIKKKKISRPKIIPQVATRDEDSSFVKAKQFLDDEAEGIKFDNYFYFFPFSFL